jgi:uridine phosphorylase
MHCALTHSLQMETFHIFHLAASWTGNRSFLQPVPSPLDASLVQPELSQPVTARGAPPDTSHLIVENSRFQPRIKAAAAQMVFASRLSQDFITPEQVAEVENWCARGVLEALRGFEITPEVKTKLSPTSGNETALI